MKVVAILSGGLDSTVMLTSLALEHDVSAISIHYGQRHSHAELSAAALICDTLGVDHTIVNVRDLGRVLSGSALTDLSIDVPEGHYEDETMRDTVVPNRNMILMSIAIGRAVALGAEAVAYGAHAGDHAVYPDCRAEFADAMDAAARLCDYNEVRLLRPFVGLRKEDIAKLGHDIGAPMELSWSCYKGGPIHCGKCGTCVERREAFALAGVPDPTEYAA